MKFITYIGIDTATIVAHMEGNNEMDMQKRTRTDRSRPVRTRSARTLKQNKPLLPSRKPNRLAGFDYSQDGFYFITSCVQDMKCVFGEIIENKMKCNRYGEIAVEQWAWLQSQYPYIVSHAFVVMPNHVHAIIEIKSGSVGSVGAVPTGRDLSVRQSSKIKSLSELIGAYKTTVSKKIHLAGYAEFGWKRSFHDHIIRDDESFITILNYIAANPLNWKDDEAPR